MSKEKPTQKPAESAVDKEVFDKKKESDTRGKESDIIGGRIIEDSIEFWYGMKKGWISEEVFKKEMARIFGVDTVTVDEKKDEKGKLQKLEIRNAQTEELLACFDVEKENKYYSKLIELLDQEEEKNKTWDN